MSKKKQNYTYQNSRRSDGLAAMLFIAPSLIGVSIFVLIPFGDVFRRSFCEGMSGKFVGVKNYATVFQNEAFILAASNTLKFVAICIPLLIIISLIVAVILNSTKDSEDLFKTTFLIPMAVPVASVVLLWKVMFHENGLISSFMVNIGGQAIDFMNTDKALMVLVISYLWKNIGYDMVLWLAGLSNISPSLYEAASIDGAGPLRRFFSITLPGLKSTFFTIAVLSLLNSFKVFREAYLIAGDYPHTSMYMLQHLFNNWFTSLDIEKLCAGAVLTAVVIFILILVFQKTWDKDDA